MKKILFTLTLLVSTVLPTFSAESWNKEVLLKKKMITEMTIQDLKQQKENLEEIYSGASKLAKWHFASKAVGVGIPAFLILPTFSGLHGIVLASMAAGTYSGLKDRERRIADEILESDLLTTQEKELIRELADQVMFSEREQSIISEIKMIELLEKKIKLKITEELEKDIYQLGGGNWFSRPQRTADYLNVSIKLKEFEINSKKSVLTKVNELLIEQ